MRITVVCSLAFLGIALYLYRPALDGLPITDDYLYLFGSPISDALDVPHLTAILDPSGDPTVRTANYAPLHLLLSLVEVRLFGTERRPYHLVNVFLHTANALLLVALFRRTSLPVAAALFGGALFLVHPANVEAVAWMSQSKTLLAFAFSMLALLLLQRRPALATCCFALSLMAKASGAFALPFAAGLVWAGSRPGTERSRSPWLLVWTLLLLAFLVPQLIAFETSGAAGGSGFTELLERTPFVVSIAARYVVMAVSSWGTSAYHAPSPPDAAWDPWLLGGAFVIAVAAWRALATCRRRDVECAYWAGFAGGFLPVSQFLPFIYPMGDRYLYFMLPGLIGVGLIAARPFFERFSDSRKSAFFAAALGVACIVFFSARAHERAGIWRSGIIFMQDSADHYPDGVQAQLLRASTLASEDRKHEAVRALTRASEGGFSSFELLLADPELSRLRGDPQFDELIGEMAGKMIENLGRLRNPYASDLISLGWAHSLRSEWSLAAAWYERALEAPGGNRPEVRVELLRVRGRLRQTP